MRVLEAVCARARLGARWVRDQHRALAFPATIVPPGCARPPIPRRRRNWIAETSAVVQGACAPAHGVRWAALTFDDGPHPLRTAPILRVLTELDVRATFFLLGVNALNDPATCREIVASGMELGNHSMRHPKLDELDAAQQGREIAEAEAAIASVTGIRPRYFRPPFGKYDATTIAIAGAHGLTVVLWNVDPKEWSGMDSLRTVRRVCDRAFDPAIIVLHDHAEPTLRAIPEIVRRYRRAGFTFVTISELLARVPLTRINAPQPLRVGRDRESRHQESPGYRGSASERS